MGDPKEELIVCRVNKYQKDVQMFTAERAFLNELSHLTANTTAICYALQNHVLLN